MSCCGKKNHVNTEITNDSLLHTVKKVTTGFSYAAIGKKSPETSHRIRICRVCDDSTWLTKLEYSAWLIKNGIKVVTNLDDLSKLSKLPKRTKGNNIFCRICKCYIPAKARVEEETCPLNKWKL